MTNIIRIRDLQNETDLENILIPVDKNSYSSNAKQITLDSISNYFSGKTNHSHPLSGLTDVRIVNPQTGDILVYSATTEMWYNTGATFGSGTAGSSGSSGTNGTNGTSGSSGKNGIAGTSGTDGAAGSSGTSGSSGISGSGGGGSSGSSGTSGSSGVTGSSGSSGMSATGITVHNQFFYLTGTSTLYVPQFVVSGITVTGLTSSGSTNYIVSDSIGKFYKTSVVGITDDVAVAKVGGGTRTLHFQNGLFTGYTDS